MLEDLREAEPDSEDGRPWGAEHPAGCKASPLRVGHLRGLHLTQEKEEDGRERSWAAEGSGQFPVTACRTHQRGMSTPAAGTTQPEQDEW